MKTKLLVVIAVAFAGCMYGQAESEYVALSPFEVTMPDNLPAVTIKRRADFVAVPVTLTCNVSDATQRIAEYRAVVSSIIEQAGKSPHLRVLNGELSLSAANHGGSFFKSSRGDAESTVVVRVLGELTDVNSVFDRAAEIKALVDGLKLSKQVKVGLGQTSLGVNEPEQYRPELVKLIAADIKMVTAALGEKFAMPIQGLDGRVQVRPVDEQNVKLYIAYRYGPIVVCSPEFGKMIQ